MFVTPSFTLLMSSGKFIDEAEKLNFLEQGETVNYSGGPGSGVLTIVQYTVLETIAEGRVVEY